MDGNEDERMLVESLGMRWVSIPWRAYWRPSNTQVMEFLRIVNDPSRQPVFVHCRHGKDRTANPLLKHVILDETLEDYLPSSCAPIPFVWSASFIYKRKADTHATTRAAWIH